MLLPKRSKYRKQMRGKLRGKSTRGCDLSFGEFGLKAMHHGFLTSRQIESARKAITSTTKRSGRVWINVFPDTPITKKPLAVRMGKGKGAVDHYAAKIRPGKMMFEMSGVTEDVAKEAFRKASHKIPFASKFIKAEDLI